MTSVLSERRESLWVLVASPMIWAAHFLVCYCTAAVACAKIIPPNGSLWKVRVAIAIYTGIALLGVAAVGWHGLARHRFGGSSLPHDDDSPEDRHRFLGFATMLLSGLSAVAIAYAALAALFIESCR